MKKKKKLSLPVQIFIALVLGIVVGLVFYFTGAAGFTTSYIKPFGDIFVNLLKFIVVPVVLLSMIDGIISMGDMKKVGAVGWKTILYFMVTTARPLRPPSTRPRNTPASWQLWLPFSPPTCGRRLPKPICFRSSSSPFFSAAASSRQEKRAVW